MDEQNEQAQGQEPEGAQASAEGEGAQASAQGEGASAEATTPPSQRDPADEGQPETPQEDAAADEGESSGDE